MWDPLEPRPFDFNKPVEIQDFSKGSFWYSDAAGAGNIPYKFIFCNQKECLGFAAFNQDRLPISIYFKKAMCKVGVERFILKATFNSRRLRVDFPEFSFKIDDENVPLKWSFIKGAMLIDSEDFEPNRFLVSTINDTELELFDKIWMSDHNTTVTPNFEVVVACNDDTELMTITVDDTWEASMPYNSSVVASVNTIEMSGSYKVRFAGYGAKGCLTLTSHGRVVPFIGDECLQELPAVCEYQACYTKEGFECQFPFTYKNKVYKKCSQEDVYLPWCPTGSVIKTSK